MRSQATSVQRIPAVQDAGLIDNPPDYMDAFEATASGNDTRSPEQWSRALFEGAPRPVRWFLLFGWRVVLGLRLGPRPSTEYVLGWKIASIEPGAVSLELQGPLMTSELVIRVEGSVARVTTHVHYKRWVARPLWGFVGVIHRRMVPYLLGRAASIPPPQDG